MKKVVITQSGEVLLASGDIKVEVNNVVENVTQGKHIQAGSILFIEDSAELNIAYEDGTELYQGQIDQIVDNNEISDALSVAAEIAQLQDLIAAEEDPTALLPETAAGAGAGNEGESHFISVGRTGDETIAAAGYSTIGSTQISLDTTNSIDSSDVDEPSALENDSNTITEDSVATGNVLDNDTDVDSDLSVVGFEVDGSTYSAGTRVILDDGTLVLNTDGNYTFTPNENWNGTVPVITYTVNTGSSATLTIVVTPVDDASILADDSNTIAEDTVATGNVLDNDADIDNDLSVMSFEVEGSTYSAGTTVILDDGSLVLNTDGSYTFTPNENWNGTVPVITYTVNTGSSATLTIAVTPVDDASILADDSNTIAEDTVATGNVLDNDADIDNDLSVVSFEVEGSTYNAGTTVILDDGSLVLNTDGSYTFTPNENWNGTVPTVTYTVNTGSSATLNIIVTPVDDASILADDNNTIAEDTVATGNVLDNDADIDNELNVVGFEAEGNTYNAGTTAILEDGSLVINSDGSYSFTPNDNWNGTVPVITYTVNTGSSANLNIIVTPVNDDFTDNDEVRTIAEDSPQVGGNVIDGVSVDGDITVTTFNIAGDNSIYQADGSNITINNVGTFSLNSNGDYTFTPAANYNGSVPVITYSLTDGSSGDTSTLSITVTPVNDDFIDNNEVRTIAEDSPEIGGNVIDGTSVDGNIMVTSFTIGSNSTIYQADGSDITINNVGTFGLDSHGDYTFTPAANYNGSVPVITYSLTDGSSGDTSTLSITVTPDNDGFTDNDEIRTIAEDSPQVDGNVIDANSVDGNITVSSFTIAGDSTTYQADGRDISISNVGTFSLDSQGNYTFTPAANYNGSVPVITYNLTDGSSGDTSTLSITVTPDNDGFTDNNEILTIAEDSPQVGDNVIDATSVDGNITVSSFTVGDDSTVYQADGSDINIANVGTFSLDSHGDYTFTPAANYKGAVPVITYSLTDGSSGDTSTLSITVTPDNDGFTDNNEILTIAEDSPQVGDNVIDGTSVDGEITVTSFTLEGNSTVYQADGSDINIANVGTFSLDSHGDYTFTPATNYNGSVPVITYSLTDGSSDDTSTLKIMVSPGNDKPTISGITDAVVSEEGLSTGLADNQGSLDTTDSVTASGAFSLQDIDGDTLSVTLSGPQGVTSGGQAVQWAWDEDTESLSGYVGTPGENSYQEIMAISLTAPAGNSSGGWGYKLTLNGAVDHSDGNAEDTLSLVLGVNVSDGNGGTASGSFSVTVEDDAPEFSAVPAVEVTFNDIPDALIGETELTHSSGVHDSLDFDGFTITGRGFSSATDSTLVKSELNGSSQGIGVASAGSPYLPLNNEVEFRKFDDGSSASEEVIITLDPGTVAFGMNIEFSKMFGGELEVGVAEFYRDGELVTSQNFTSDANHGDYAANFEVLEGGFDSVVIRATDNGRPAEHGDNSDLTIKSIEFVGVETGDPIAYASGTVTPEWGADGAGSIELTGSDETGLVTSSGEAITITQSGNTLLGQTASGVVIFKLEFTPGTGQWDFHQYQDIKPTTDGDIDFNVLITDGDGDSVEGEFAVKPKTSTPPETQEDSLELTEGESTNFNEASLLDNDDGYDSGSLSVISLATNSWGSGAIATTELGASFTTALGGTVTINPDGSYSYQAPASLVHNGSDNLTDSFYYQSSNGVEKSTWTKVTVNVADTAPVANDDTDSIGFGGTAHGNVITAAGTDGAGVDSLGADSANISSVSYGGIRYSDFDAEGNLTITTDDGILTVNQDGNYSYQSTLNEFVNLDAGALVVGNGVQLYGFNSSTDFVNGNTLNRSMLTENGIGIGGNDTQVGAGNNEWIEYGESVVIDLEANFNEVSLGLNGGEENASSVNGQWSIYDNDGQLVDRGSFSGSDSLNLDSGQAYQYVVITADSSSSLSLTSLQTVVVHPLTSDEFEYILTDADGDSDSATLLINQDSNPEAINDSASVAESGLASGTTAGDGSNITTGNLLDNDSGVSSSTHITEVEGVAAVNGVITVTTALGELAVYSEDSTDHRAGDYEYKLTANSTDGDIASESFDYTLTNSLGSNSSASLTVKISDDAPVVHDISQNLQANADVVTTNLTLVLDVSGSMGDPVGNGQTYLEVAIDALTALINEVDSTGNVNIQIVNFHSNTGSSGWLIDDVAGAISYLESLVTYGPTHYDAALNAVMNSGSLPDGADQSLLYFISDGSPSPGQEVDPALQSIWESYLVNSGYKTAFGIGIGSAGLSDLLPVAYPEVDGDEVYAVKLDDPEDLASTILNYFDGDTIKGSYTTGVVFGADGGHIESIAVDGVTHNYDGVNPVQVFMTALGGKFTVNFDTGEYSYSIDVDRDVLNEQESLVAVVTDGDGDTASVTLDLGIDYHANLDANSNNIITNLAEGTTIDIPVEYLLHGDKTAGNAGVTQVSGDNVTLNGGVVTLSSTTEDSSFNYTLKGSSDKGEDTTHVDLDYAQQLIGTAENDIIINSGNGEVMPNDALITAIVTPGENWRPIITNPFGFKFASNSDALSVTSVSVNLKGGHDNDAFIENYALGDSIGLNPSFSIFTLSEDGSIITAKFAEGDFTSGDEFWFTLDTSMLNSNASNAFAQQAVTFTVALSDGSEKSGVYLAYEGGAQSKLVFGDVLDGGAGDDVLVGGSDSDILLGGDGNDMMIGGLGDDILSGGSGADTFIWAKGEEGTDHITDFDLNEDKLDLSDLLQGENNGNLDEYLNFSVDSASHSTTIDIDGDGDGTFEQHIVLDGVDLKAAFGNTDGQIINGLLGENGEGPLIIDTQSEDAAALSTGTGSTHSMDDEQMFHAIP
ncbi:putative outer membrane adhesin like protein [Shewanella sediminis HAW-EB3]|uniref:Putative outer membrane adhesin like protein n=1 Tax=Shewanella sediminis (strain HAW-EB3) TaxID=425104 RepID=A8FVS8_SHESH|nr:putative outer membrane adhesin like protein [Shewanella sediminis HAW-EB3]